MNTTAVYCGTVRRIAYKRLCECFLRCVIDYFQLKRFLWPVSVQSVLLWS